MSIVRRIANAFHRSKLDQEIDAELRSHIEMRTADNIAAGMPPDEARREALLRFGNRALVRERVASMDAEVILDAVARDLRYTMRQLRRAPGFTVTAVLTLALGVGANVVVFGVLNAVILRLVDVPQAAGLYNVVQRPHGYENQSYPDYADYRRLNSTFSDMAAYRLYSAGLSTGTSANKSWLYEVSCNYFDMLGAQPQLGRFFHASDERGPNSAPYIVLSDNFWRSRFNANRAIVGTTIEVNKHPFTIIGVAPSSFHGTDLFIWPDFWLPIVNEQQVEGYDFLSKRFNHGMWILGKLKSGVTPQQAEVNLNAVAGRLAKEFPDPDEGMGARLVKPGLMGEMLGDPARAFLSGVMLLALLVLIAACANLASIFAARTADRSRELAIRLAIGSSRWHVLRQVLGEAVAVSIIGGLMGTFLAAILLNALTRWQPFAEFPIHVTVTPDIRVYGVAALLSLASGLLFGLLPMRQLWRTSPIQVMKGGSSMAVFRPFSLRDLLLGIQIALCTLLVTASLVALRGMLRSWHAPLGFQPVGATLADTDLQMAGYSDDASLRVRKRMLEETSRIPGVTAVGLIDEAPLGGGGSSGPVYRPGTTDFRSTNSAFEAKFFSISPGYLEAAGTHLLMGRDFTWHDDAHSPRVALVNEAFAKGMFPTLSAVRLHFLMGDRLPYEIVGVVENGKYDSLTEATQPAIFFPFTQSAPSDTSLIVRSQSPAAEMVPALSRVLARIDPNLPFTIHSWPDALALVLFPARVATVALGVMGGLAAMLAVTGVFGMATYSVSKRIKELGIRMALGAQPVRVMGAALRRPLVLLFFGSVTGLILGIIASQLLAQIVYQATSRDPLVFAGVMTTMIVLGLVAISLPAHRALRIHPAGLLREE
ncbi:MAG TPA: ABC transporter permease [Candidatus Cybelea sp.]|nr:ABC transporter permease [Candidatus Cybelea sp.]